jgi:predicted nicotinamide N-methyase
MQILAHTPLRMCVRAATCHTTVARSVTLRLAQDPNSEHLGTTVWDASIVLAKYLERGMRKGELSRPKVSGKRGLELGAGMGLAGLSLALLGADVTLTDVAEVLPLLQANYERNLSPAALRGECDDVLLLLLLLLLPLLLLLVYFFCCFLPAVPASETKCAMFA